MEKAQRTLPQKQKVAQEASDAAQKASKELTQAQIKLQTKADFAKEQISKKN